MKTLLIGHRGVGKSSLLKRIAAYHKNSVETIDLDTLIEKGEGVSVSDIFTERGEAEFRTLEKKYLLRALARSGSSFIAIGAGFQFDDFKIPADVSVWWVKRPTDSAGRVFLDRPRLNASTSAFDEYIERFPKREDLYARHATDVLIMDEGFESETEPERKWVVGEISSLEMDLTVTAAAFRQNFESWFFRRKTWGVRFFELRDDLLSQAQIKQALRLIPPQHVLFSFRSLDALASSRELLDDHPAVAFDWAHELGVYGGQGHGQRRPGFFSFHHCGERSLADCLEAAEKLQIGSPSAVLKIALPIENFEELALAHDWMMQDQRRRVVLPSSATGRWSWYRLWQKRHLKLNFMREDNGSASDQPTLLQVLRAQRTPGATNYAAVLGQPVRHSRTPAEQHEFFSKRGWPVYQIDISEAEWPAALIFLRKLGLKAAAVTSPLKLKAFTSSEATSDVARKLQSVNTLWFGKNLQGHNTDEKGFTILLTGTNISDQTGVWGGGGTLALVRSLVPQVKEFSARTGELRSGGLAEVETLIWAVSRARFTGLWPKFAPKLIIDLNYGDDSPGRELALKTGARYVSGLAMFKEQAQGQREFWKRNEEFENVSQ